MLSLGGQADEMAKNKPPKMPLIDPTKNVLDLVHAAMKRQDDMREAETRRLDQLAEQRSHYNGKIADIRDAHNNELKLFWKQMLDERAELLGVSLQEVKKDVYDRLALLEQFRWQTGGSQEGARVGRSETVAWIVAGVMAIIAMVVATTHVLTYIRASVSTPPAITEQSQKR